MNLSINDVCRICLSEKTATRNLFDYFSNAIVDGYIVMFPELAKKYLDIESRLNDGLPDKICDCCKHELTNFHMFKEKTARSQRILLSTSTEHQHLLANRITDARSRTDETGTVADKASSTERIGDITDMEIKQETETGMGIFEVRQVDDNEQDTTSATAAQMHTDSDDATHKVESSSPSEHEIQKSGEEEQHKYPQIKMFRISKHPRNENLIRTMDFVNTTAYTANRNSAVIHDRRSTISNRIFSTNVRCKKYKCYYCGRVSGVTGQRCNTKTHMMTCSKRPANSDVNVDIDKGIIDFVTFSKLEKIGRSRPSL